MNTNTVLIGILILLVLGFGGWYLMSTPAPGSQQTVTDSGTDTGTVSEPTAGMPAVITNTSVGVSNSTAIVTGSVIPNGSQTTYWYEYGLTEALGSNTAPQAVGSGFISIPTPAYITGLKANTQYFYRLSAKNGYGTVNAQTYSLTTNSTPPVVGSAPTIATEPATDVARTTTGLSGRVDPNNSETWYWFEWGTTNDLGNAKAPISIGSGADMVHVSVSLAGLTPATKYYYRVNAQNRYGTVTGSILTFTTDGPPVAVAPTASTNAATDIATNHATLNAHVDPNGSETKYWFEYSKDSLLGNLIGNGTAKKSAGSGQDNIAVSANVSNLTKNTTYYYRVVAQSAAGTVRGSVLSFTTSP